MCVLVSLQLNIHKPLRDIIDSMCGTFNICNPNEFHLWIPAGIQSIIEKYGGRPVSLLLFVCCVVYNYFLLFLVQGVLFVKIYMLFVFTAEKSCWSVQEMLVLFHWRFWYV